MAGRLAVLGACAVAPVLAAGAGPAAAASTAVPGSSAFVPVAPCRLLDTRQGGRPGTSVTVTVAGSCGVPLTASAVVVTLTVPGATAAGYVTAHPAGGTLPLASNLNVVAGATVANTALVRLAGGAFTLDSNVAVHEVVDVVGYFAPAATAHAGRYVATTPARLLDTRTAAKVPPGGTAVAPVTGVPSDAVAVAVNLTFTETTAPGFFTAHGPGPRPLASTGNADAAGQTRAIFTLVPTATAVQVFSQSGAHVVVDLVGYVTGPSADEATDGLLVPQDPVRALDTRSVGPPLAVGASLDVPAPAAGAAVWATVTAVDAPAPGFFTVWAAGTPRPSTSTVNASAAREVVANATIARLSDRGLSVFAHPGGHVVIDVAGVFLGPPIDTAPAPIDEVIGRSFGGRPIVATHRRDHEGAARKVLVLGSMHGEEQAGVSVVAALRTAVVPADVDLWLMDTMNPDGGATGQRGNGRGVDLNRNFDGGSFPWCPSPGCGTGAGPANTGTGPLSEPETQAFWAFLQRERFDLVVSYHQPLNTVDCSPLRGPELLAVCQAYATVSGIPLNNPDDGGYIDISGTMTNAYMQANAGRWAFTMEFPATGVGDVGRHVAAVWAAAAAL
jgi:Zinc carboxypeptidase